MDWIAIAVLVFLILILLYYYYVSKCTLIYRFYLPGCIHCDRSEADWKAFKQSVMFSMIMPIDVNMKNPTQKEKDLFNELGGQGYPHIVKVKPCVKRPYDIYQGDRSSRSIGYFALI